MVRWYYSDAGEVVGPFTQARLFELRNAALITDDTLVWGEGRDGWVSLVELSAPVTPPPLPPLVPSPHRQPAIGSATGPAKSPVLIRLFRSGRSSSEPKKNLAGDGLMAGAARSRDA